MINDGPFFKFPFCSAWGLASVDMHSTRINGFGKPTRLSTWQQMVQLRAFVVLMLELAATWSSYRFISKDIAAALWINCPFILCKAHHGCWQLHGGESRTPSHSAAMQTREENAAGWRKWGWRWHSAAVHVLYACPSAHSELWSMKRQMFPLCWRVKSDP